LQVEIIGKGEPLLLIHGWGMHSGMWDQVAEQLALSHRVHLVDLPGHGLSKLPSPARGRGAGGEGADQDALSLTLSRERERGQNLLDEIVAQMSAQFSEPITVCGWSLGGQVALRWAKLQPAQIKKLILVATTPCFVQQDGWDCAMAAGTLQGFAVSLLQNHALTLKRFLALQLRGSENEREILLDLRARLFAHGEPDVAALKGGLDILRDTDLRSQLKAIQQSTLLIAGERDTLTPSAALEYMAQTLPNARLEVVQGAAHAPFLSHCDEFVRMVNNFTQE